MVSALMLTLNSRDTIQRSLDSIANFVEEIVVVDGGSSDGTVEVARGYGATILSRKFFGFAEERNAGLQLIHGEWVLSLDSDEVVSPALESELRRLVAEDIHDVIYVPRLDYIAGHVMRSFYPDYQPKLYRKGCLRYVGKVHEVPQFNRAVRRYLAANPLVNYSDRTMGERFRREVRYWTLALPGNRSIRRRWLSLPMTIVKYPLLLLFQRRFLKDGLHGLTVALLFLAAYLVALHRLVRTQQTTAVTEE